MNNFFVIAGNKQEYDNYCRKQIEAQLVYDDKYFVWVSGPDTFRGYKDPVGVCTGTWRDRPDILDIIMNLRMTATTPEKTQKIKHISDLIADHMRKETNRLIYDDLPLKVGALTIEDLTAFPEINK